MQYYVLANKKHHFLVTPNELRQLLEGFHHVIINTGVKKNYTESDPNDFFLTYEALYRKLKNGEKLIWEKDYNIASFTVGITHHLENCLYKPTDKLSVPHFLEPCPYIDTFCFTYWQEKLSASFTVTQCPENVCGLRLCFPTKIEYSEENAKHKGGIAINTEFDDFEPYERLVSEIKKITKPLKLEIDGRIHRTPVRISNESKKDMERFYFIASNGIRVF